MGGGGGGRSHAHKELLIVLYLSGDLMSLNNLSYFFPTGLQRTDDVSRLINALTN